MMIYTNAEDIQDFSAMAGDDFYTTETVGDVQDFTPIARDGDVSVTAGGTEDFTVITEDNYVFVTLGDYLNPNEPITI